jgi:hypothetical protein
MCGCDVVQSRLARLVPTDGFHGLLDLRWSSAMLVVSTINGRPAQGPDAGLLHSASPSRLTDVVAEVTLADATARADACRVAKQAQLSEVGIATPLRGGTITAIRRIADPVTRDPQRPDLRTTCTSDSITPGGLQCPS